MSEGIFFSGLLEGVVPIFENAGEDLQLNITTLLIFFLWLV